VPSRDWISACISQQRAHWRKFLGALLAQIAARQLAVANQANQANLAAANDLS